MTLSEHMMMLFFTSYYLILLLFSLFNIIIVIYGCLILKRNVHAPGVQNDLCSNNGDKRGASRLFINILFHLFSYKKVYQRFNE